MKETKILILFICMPLLLWGTIQSDSIRTLAIHEAAANASKTNLELCLSKINELEGLSSIQEDCLEMTYVSEWKLYYAGAWMDVDRMKTFYQEAVSRLDDCRASMDPVEWEKAWMDLQPRIANTFEKAGEFEQAKELLYSLIERLEQKENLDPSLHQTMIVAYIRLGAINEVQGNLNQALEYYQYCIDYEKEVAQKENRPARIESSFARLAQVFLSQKKYQKAIDNFKLTLDYYEKNLAARPQLQGVLEPYIIPIYEGLAKAELALNNQPEALKHAKKGFDFPQANVINQAKSQLLLGEVYAQTKDRQLALFHLQKAAEKLRLIFPEGANKLIGDSYAALGDYYQQIGGDKKALDHYQNALIQYSEGFSSLEIEHNPNPTNSKAKRQHFSVLIKKAEIQHQQGDWAGSWSTALNALEMLELLRKQNINRHDLQELIEGSYPLFETILEIAFTHQEEYLEAAFTIIESSKALHLQRAQQLAFATQYAQLPQQLISEETQLKNKLLMLEKARFQQLQVSNTDKVRFLQNRISETRRSLNRLIQDIQNKHPEYALFRYTVPKVKIDSLQHYLKHSDQALVEFFAGANHLYQFVLDGERLQLIRSAINEKQLMAASQLKEGIFSQDKAKYTQQARSLYQLLWQPIQDFSLPKRVIIISDGRLGHVPFEALLYDDIDEKEEYKSYPFLLKRHQISYNYAASLISNAPTTASKSKGSFLGIAPVFTSAAAINNPIALRTDLPPLKFNQEEVIAIRRMTCGSSILGRKASKEDVLALLPKYRFIHIASHAKANDVNPDFSYIAFTNGQDSLEESYKLYIRELYNLELNADMVVLSACETGQGTALLGEGVISLARGFTYAGAQSVVTTLWGIDDYTTKEIMQLFYGFLEEGLEKDHALQVAKLAYLDQTDKFGADPFYWAAFIPLGDMSAVHFQKKCQSLLFLWAVPLLLIIMVFFWRRRTTT